MNKLIYSLMLQKSFSSGNKFIRNKNLPVCIDCLHFIEDTNNYPYDPLPSNKIYGKCKKFGEINFITGLIEYDFAKICRDDINKCGKNGLEYQAK